MDSAFGHLGFRGEWSWAISTLVVCARIWYVWGIGADADDVGEFSLRPLCLMIWGSH